MTDQRAFMVPQKTVLLLCALYGMDPATMTQDDLSSALVKATHEHPDVDGSLCACEACEQFERIYQEMLG